MGEIAARFCVPCQQQVLVGHFSRRKWKEKLNRHEWQCNALTEPKSKQPLVKNQIAMNSATYSSRMTTDIPLYESPGASFDRYLEHKPRVFDAIFPDKRRSQQLNETAALYSVMDARPCYMSDPRPAAKARKSITVPLMIIAENQKVIEPDHKRVRYLVDLQTHEPEE
ncbi:unnamed protein product [Dovyalis caffra]|uniref:Uncharacterized protein n=1 Tax=Dovyalis caffra TaxID=77055 RepID=A0AAV1QRI8_9ROSI|nr:unnamed protein product [Dovyalis caffra]